MMGFNEENARITLLGCIMTLYVLLGAIMIRKLESPFEKQVVRNYWKAYEEFEQKLLNGTAETEELKTLLYMYGNVTSAFRTSGEYEKWNFWGSLNFVITIVTTIGYGSHTPNTNEGKIFVILYGFLGCAGGILFFNLFLERMITFLAYILREIYIRKINARNPESGENIEQLLADWKPSIYSVMLCLLIGVITIGSVIVPAYALLEGWSYVEAAYFCFVSFATIGFGDLVAAQHNNYSNFYVFTNTVILAIGCCFLYSVFNVISIVLKQILNWLMYRLKVIKIWCHLDNNNHHPERVIRKYSLKMQRERKNNQRRKSSIQIIRRTLRKKTYFNRASLSQQGTSQVTEKESIRTDRKLSDDGLTSMKDFFTSNQVSLALMQKQLQESAQQAKTYPGPANSPFTSRHPVPTVSATTTSTHKNSLPAGRFIPGTIGPLAILCDKLGDK